MANASALPAFKDLPESSSFGQFKYLCEESVEQNAVLPFADPLRKMFEGKFQWYESMGSKLENVKLRFEKSGSDVTPGLTAKQDFGEKEIVLEFPWDFCVSKDEMCKLPANAHLLKLQQQGENINFVDMASIWWNSEISNAAGKWHTYLQASQYYERFMPTISAVLWKNNKYEISAML